MGTDDPTTAESIYAERNKGAYVMGEDSMDIDNLLSTASLWRRASGRTVTLDADGEETC